MSGSLTRDDEACSFVRVRYSELSLSKQYGCLSIVSEAPSDRLRFGFGFGFKKRLEDIDAMVVDKGGRSEATKKKSFVHSLNGHQGRVSGLVVRPCAHRQAITITSFCATRFVVWPLCLHVIPRS